MKPKAPPPKVVEAPEDDLHDDFDPVLELEQLQARYDTLEARANALLAEDSAKELDKYIAMANGLQSRLNQELVKNSEMDKSLRSYVKAMAHIRKELGASDDRDILALIRDLKAK